MSNNDRSRYEDGIDPFDSILGELFGGRQPQGDPRGSLDELLASVLGQRNSDPMINNNGILDALMQRETQTIVLRQQLAKANGKSEEQAADEHMRDLLTMTVDDKIKIRQLEHKLETTKKDLAETIKATDETVGSMFERVNDLREHLYKIEHLPYRLESLSREIAADPKRKFTATELGQILVRVTDPSHHDHGSLLKDDLCCDRKECCQTRLIAKPKRVRKSRAKNNIVTEDDNNKQQTAGNGVG